MKKVNPLLFANFNISKLLKYTLLSVAVLYLLTYLCLAFFRLSYPYELEWIEGGMVDQVQRLVNGQTMYVAPSINFVPYLYTPLYFYLSAAASIVFGGGLFPLRLVSFLASLVSFTTIFLIVRAETKNWWLALLSVGLFAATYRVTGAWLDIARVDSLFLALWLLFIYFVRGRKSIVYSLLTGVLAALAFLTKQTTLILCLPIIAYLFWANWKYALFFIFVTTLTIGITTSVLNLQSAGWYTYYVFGLFQQTEWLHSKFLIFWKDDLLVYLPIAVLFTLFFLAGNPKHDRPNLIRWMAILVGALAGAFLSRVKIGGYENVLLPAYAILSILFGLGAGEIIKLSVQLNGWNRCRLELLVYFACLIQMVILVYNPLAQIPTKADLTEGNRLIQFISDVDGEVFLPDHGYLSTLAGKRTYAHEAAIFEVLRGNQHTVGKELLAEDLRDSIRQQTFDMIILDWESERCCVEIDQHYTRVEGVFDDETTFYPVTGFKSRPTFVYIANRLK